MRAEVSVIITCPGIPKPRMNADGRRFDMAAQTNTLFLMSIMNAIVFYNKAFFGEISEKQLDGWPCILLSGNISTLLENIIFSGIVMLLSKNGINYSRSIPHPFLVNWL